MPTDWKIEYIADWRIEDLSDFKTTDRDSLYRWIHAELSRLENEYYKTDVKLDDIITK